MNNIELEVKILDILQTPNFFDMVLKAKEFEKEYKTSDFYKITKMPLSDVIRQSKIYYALQLKDLGKTVQDLFNNLSIDNLTEVLNKIEEIYTHENEEIQNGLEVFKDLHN